MFGRGITLFHLLGFKVKADISWLFLATLVTLSLATGYFPYRHPDLSPQTYWWMGFVGAAGLFASIVFHELSHSLVARRFGMPIRGITLFIFGGVAEMEEEPPTARAEFLMAVAGPVASGLLSLAFYLATLVAEAGGVPAAVSGVASYLAFINMLLAAFNLVPAFPLDGGRMLRAVLWYWKGDIRLATRIASNAGAAFGFFLIAVGLVNLVNGNWGVGIWYGLIGLFIRAAAASSYMQMQTRQFFEGEPVSRFMITDPVVVPADVTVRQLVEDYVYTHYHELFPVTADTRLLGCVGLGEIRKVPREKWSWTQVRDIMARCGQDNTVSPDEDAVRALALMRRTGNSRLMVVRNGDLVGLVTLKDLLHLISLKMDLEGQG